ncbi:MAG: hypothetical protein HDS39_04405 [Bacteroides sp.]|nr:hypothetical protein [Bacteroides sp.]
MKKIRNYFVLMMVALMSVASFTSCNGDDDDDPDSPAGNSKIVGTWKAVHVISTCKENGKIVDQYDGPVEGTHIREFTSNGKLIVTDGSSVVTGVYVLSGDKLTGTSEYGETEVLYVKKLDSRTLELESTFKETDNGYTHEDYLYIIFERLK